MEQDYYIVSSLKKHEFVIFIKQRPPQRDPNILINPHYPFI